MALPDHQAREHQSAIPQTDRGVGHGPHIQSTSKEIEVKCGPLLNYKRMSNENTSSPTWHVSVLIVTSPGQVDPRLSLRSLGPVSSTASTGQRDHEERAFRAEKLYEDARAAFWRFLLDVPVQAFEARWQYTIPSMTHLSGSTSASQKVFCVPAASQSMRIMFHSCNGFREGTDMESYSGPGAVVWEDVLRQHEEMPIHCAIGGGDRTVPLRLAGSSG